MIKLQQVRDDALSLADLVHFTPTDLILTGSPQTVSYILRDFDMISYIAPKKTRITPAQRHTRADWRYEYLSSLLNQWLNDESNNEILNRKNRIYVRRF